VLKAIKLSMAWNGEIPTDTLLQSRFFTAALSHTSRKIPSISISGPQPIEVDLRPDELKI
jgi:hypothetical protein